MKTVRNPNDPKLDKFYDETPQVAFHFELYVTTVRHPYGLTYKERLDGTVEENRQVLDKIKEIAQADMYNILQRLQARDEDTEFSKWVCKDEAGAIIDESNILTITVK